MNCAVTDSRYRQYNQKLPTPVVGTDDGEPAGRRGENHSLTDGGGAGWRRGETRVVENGAAPRTPTCVNAGRHGKAADADYAPEDDVRGTTELGGWTEGSKWHHPKAIHTQPGKAARQCEASHQVDETPD